MVAATRDGGRERQWEHRQAGRRSCHIEPLRLQAREGRHGAICVAGALVTWKRNAISVVDALLVVVSQQGGNQAAAASTDRDGPAGLSNAREVSCVGRSTAVYNTSRSCCRR